MSVIKLKSKVFLEEIIDLYILNNKIVLLTADGLNILDENLTFEYSINLPILRYKYNVFHKFGKRKILFHCIYENDNKSYNQLVYIDIDSKENFSIDLDENIDFKKIYFWQNNTTILIDNTENFLTLEHNKIHKISQKEVATQFPMFYELYQQSKLYTVTKQNDLYAFMYINDINNIIGVFNLEQNSHSSVKLILNDAHDFEYCQKIWIEISETKLVIYNNKQLYYLKTNSSYMSLRAHFFDNISCGNFVSWKQHKSSYKSILTKYQLK